MRGTALPALKCPAGGKQQELPVAKERPTVECTVACSPQTPRGTDRLVKPWGCTRCTSAHDLIAVTYEETRKEQPQDRAATHGEKPWWSRRAWGTVACGAS